MTIRPAHQHLEVDQSPSPRPGDPQLVLPSLAASNGGLGDSAFTENRQEPVHRWVPWIAGFAASFVGDALSRIEPRQGQTPTVLDPFAGVGTTLVEGMRRGFRAVGFEINPYAALACRAKLRVGEYNVGELRHRAEALTRFVASRSADPSASPATCPPTGFRSRAPFFSPSVERQVLFALDFIGGEKSPVVADLLRVALGGTMVGFSNYSYEPSLGRRVAAGKQPILEADVAAVLRTKLGAMCRDVEWWQRHVHGTALPAEVHLQSYLTDPCPLPPASVDLLVTSPPYLNNYHYPRNTRPQLYWLGLVTASPDVKRLEQESFGKFWQTVRAAADVPLEFDDPELGELLRELKSRNAHRGVYGGQGWANYAATYFNDCDRFCRRTAGLMRPGGLVIVVIGNNIVQGIEFRTDQVLARIAERWGLQLVDIHRVRRKRTGSSIINSSVRQGNAGGKVELYESAVELRKPSG